MHKRGLQEHCCCFSLFNLLNCRQENFIMRFSKREPSPHRKDHRTSMEITVLNLSFHIWKYIQIPPWGRVIVHNYCVQDYLIFLLNFCFDTKLLEWIPSTTLIKLFILQLLHQRAKCNLYLKIWERVSLLSRNQRVNGDRDLKKRNKTINGKSSLVADSVLWTQVLQPVQSLIIEDDSTLSKEHDICDYYW